MILPSPPLALIGSPRVRHISFLSSTPPQLRFVTLEPAVYLVLPSDSTSRWTPLSSAQPSELHPLGWRYLSTSKIYDMSGTKKREQHSCCSPKLSNSYLAIAATSAAKSSCFFSIPSPTMYLTNLTTSALFSFKY